MFEELRSFNKILVTGPQRAGTKIASKMIAHDTGYQYIDEHDYGGFYVDRFKKAISGDNIVVQCPTMSGRIEDFTTDDMLVVFMFRDIEDIARSEDRVDWSVGVYNELYNYGFRVNEAKRYRQAGGRTAPLKYKRWKIQKQMIEHHIDLEYESLSKHSLWIPKEQRIYAEREAA